MNFVNQTYSRRQNHADQQKWNMCTSASLLKEIVGTRVVGMTNDWLLGKSTNNNVLGDVATMRKEERGRCCRPAMNPVA